MAEHDALFWVRLITNIGRALAYAFLVWGFCRYARERHPPGRPACVADWTAIVGLLVIGAIGGMAVHSNTDIGMAVGSGAVGAIGGWLARGASKTTTTTEPPDKTTTEVVT